MANEYLTQLEAEHGQQPENTYLSTLEAERQQRTAALRGSLTQAVGADPEQVAHQRRVASYLGYPTAAVQALPGLEQRAKLQQIESTLADAPKTRERFTDSDFAKLAHDDVDNMTLIERGLRQFSGGLVDWAGTRVHGVGVALDIAHRNITGAMVDMLPKPRGGDMTPGGRQSATGPSLAPDWLITGQAVQRLARNEIKIPEGRQTFGDQVAAGLGQVTGQVLSYPFSGGPAGLYLDGMSVMDEKVRGDNASQGSKDLATLAGAVVTGVTEKWALDKLLGPVGDQAKASLTAALTRIGIAAASEGAQEATESIAQDLLRQQLTNADADIQLAGALQEGSVGAAVGGIVRGIVESALHVRTRHTQRVDAAYQAEADAQALQKLATLAEASKVRGRDAEAFEAFVRDAAKESDLRDVFVPAQVLQQAGKLEQLAAVSPAVAEQAAQALGTGGDIRIPVEEFAARIAGAGLAQDLIGELKTDPGGMTLNQARAFAQDQMQGVAEDVTQQVERSQRQEQIEQDARAIEATVLEQLNAAGRFSPSVNKAYAQLPRAFFETLGQRIGANPRELFEHFAPQILAEGVTGSAVLDQGPALDEVLRGWSTAGVEHAVRENSDRITVSKIVVPDGARGQGAGTAAMRQLLEYADRTGKHVVLSPSADFGGDKARLVKFYKGLGFVENKGKNRAFSTSESMYRQAPGKVLQQLQRGGFVPAEFTEGGKPVIALLKGADLSTFLHEAGHWFLETYAAIAESEPLLQGDMQILFDWMGVKDLAAWQGMTLDQKRVHHEQFARGFEKYLAEGRAPTWELGQMFARFRDWLAAVYKNLAGLNVELTDEVRAVMDRMLATDDQIRRAEAGRSMAPLFRSQEQAERFGVNWGDYKTLDVHATAQAVEELEARSVRDMAWTSRLRASTVRRMNNEAAELRKQMREAVEAEVQTWPVYAAQRWLKRGETTGPQGEQIKAQAGHRLSTEALRQMYPVGGLASVNWQKLGYGAYGMLAEKGMHPDQVADMFGFASGDAMVRELLDAQPLQVVVDGITDQRMLEQHADLSSPQAIARAADAAIHNDVRTRFLATELAGLRKAVGGALELARMAKEQAARIVDNTPAGKLRPAQFAAAEVRAGKAAEEALRRGEVEEAARQKRFQLINHAATRAAYEAQAEAAKTLALFRSIADGSAETVGKSRNMDLVNTARAILAEYGVGMRGKNPRAYMDAVKAYDPELFATVEPMLQDAEEGAKPLDDLMIGELRALRDNVDSLWYLSRREKLVEIDGQLVERAQVTDTLGARLETLGMPGTVPGEDQAVTEGEKRVRYLMGARAALRRVESWATRMDGGDMGGAFRRFVFTPISEAADAYRADTGNYLKRYRDLLQAIERTLAPGRIHAPELGNGYTFGASKGDAGMAELLHAILHTGNESNKRKLLLGRGWASETAEGGLDTRRWDAFAQRMINEGKLTRAHFEFAQGVWDLLEEIKPMAQRTHREVFGRYFDEVSADAFTNSLGTWRGGYVPAIADTFEVQDAAINAELEAVNQGNAFMFPATSRGFTKSRVEYNRPLALDLRLLPQHIDKAILFAHMEPKVRDVMRTLRAKGLAGKLNRYDPVVYTDLLLPWLNRAAKQTVETPATGWGGKLADRFFRAARSRAGMAAMFANLTNAMQQVTGFSVAAVRVKPGHLARASMRYLRAPAEVSAEVARLSPFMANRLDGQAMRMRQDIEELLLNPGRYEKAKAWSARHAYFLQSAFQNVVDTITWAGAYDQALASGTAEREAVR
ncbi:GNAT family N-acetyltransferase, partial [Aquabacterium sp. UBA2148]|uniref:GNAT family N-acetyltransferase n=1 Tax=Aquabacterium sp. UBA2148 TaxID=1946042 RepID=UPI00257DB4E1